MSEKNEAICLKCGHQWKTKFTADTLPYGAQCPQCMGYTIILVKHYEQHLNKLRRIVTPKDAKKFLELYNFAGEHGYVRNPSSRDVKFRRLLQDLAKP